MNNGQLKSSLIKLSKVMDELHIPYQYINESALFLQGVALQESHNAFVAVQWDLIETLYEYLDGKGIKNISPLTKSSSMASFTILFEGIQIHVECHYNTTVRTDPFRISIQEEESSIWVRSLYTYFYDQELYDRFGQEINMHLSKLQQDVTNQNRQAWNQEQYDALVERYGNQEQLAIKIKENPKWRLHPFYRHLGDVENKNIVHLLGSNGIKGVALALLGANVTVVDFSKENKTFATELANTADVPMQYIHSDVFSLHEEGIEFGQADIVLMELGVLHYFVNLHSLIGVIKSLLKQGGQFVLHEFHPISTKLITSSGKKHKITGNYFNPEIQEQNVAFSKHMQENGQAELQKVLQRKWTLGEVITAVAQEGLMVKMLEEEPNHKIHDIGLPKTFTLIAEKL